MGGEREDAADVVDEFRGLLEAHREAGSMLARKLLGKKGKLGDEVWLIEPLDTVVPAPAPVIIRAAPVRTDVGANAVRV
jgi:hypothetical protein